MSNTHSTGLILNVVPVTFSDDEIEIGRIAYPGAQSYQELRDRYWRTHAFRHDARSGDILNVTLIPTEAPLGRR
jgi:hypothetical protein